MAGFRYSGIWCSLVTSSPVTDVAGFRYSGIWCSLVTSSPVTGVAGFRYSGIWSNSKVLPLFSRISKFWKSELIKLRVSWAGHVAGMVDERKLVTVRLENKDQLEIGSSNRKILLYWLLVKECQGLWSGFIHFEVQVVGCFDHSYEPSVFLNCRKCLNQL
jgi:hypothetical protein